MNTYRVLILGEHFAMDVSDGRHLLGFYATRFPPAATSDESIISAIAVIHADFRLHGLILNVESDPPRLQVEALEAVPYGDVPEQIAGFGLYREQRPSSITELSPPSYLLIRTGMAFWIERRPLADWTATARALPEGCFGATGLFDTKGRLWQIVHGRA